MPRTTPYTVATFRRGAAEASAYREQRHPWVPRLVGVVCDIQAGAGEMEATAAGQRTDTRRSAWFATGVDLVPGDGVEVTAGPGLVGQRFTVEDAMDWGAPGDLEAKLRRTTEVFE